MVTISEGLVIISSVNSDRQENVEAGQGGCTSCPYDLSVLATERALLPTDPYGLLHSILIFPGYPGWHLRWTEWTMGERVKERSLAGEIKPWRGAGVVPVPTG
jgi:hypothetical protein